MRAVSRKVEAFLNKTFANIYCDGPSLNRRWMAGLSAMPVCTHRSQTDYFLLGQFLNRVGLQRVRFAAGDNLTELPILGPQFRRWGAFPIRRARARNRTYVRTLCEQVTGMLIDGDNVVVFPEGGRSYQGNMMEMKYGMIGACLLAQWRRPDETFTFFPVAISYERLPELLYFDMLQKGKRIRSANSHVLNQLRGSVYYFGADILAFTKFCAASRLKRRYGDVFVDFEAPVAVNDLVPLSSVYNSRARDEFSGLRAGMQTVAGILFDTFVRLYRLLPIHVVSSILDGARRCSLQEMRLVVADTVAMLQRQQRNMKSLETMSEDEIIDRALVQLRAFKSVRMRRGSIIVRKPTVIAYHAASILAHKEVRL